MGLAILFSCDGKAWREPTIGMEFIWISPGEFNMGSNSIESFPQEKPVHRVALDGFWMGKYEVTQGQWRAIMGDNPSHFKLGDNYPVEQVSWDDVQDFIKRLNARTGGNFRLPTEAEWEFACRAGTIEDRYGEVWDIAWYAANSGGQTHPVGQKKSNSFGLYDMLGNVCEWCQDFDGEYSRDFVKNPSGPSSGLNRIYKGGCWSDDARNVRATKHLGGWPSGDGVSSIGLRLAKTK